jgi:hypothetical protein
MSNAALTGSHGFGFAVSNKFDSIVHQQFEVAALRTLTGKSRTRSQMITKWFTKHFVTLPFCQVHPM